MVLHERCQKKYYSMNNKFLLCFFQINQRSVNEESHHNGMHYRKYFGFIPVKMRISTASSSCQKILIIFKDM